MDDSDVVPRRSALRSWLGLVCGAGVAGLLALFYLKNAETSHAAAGDAFGCFMTLVCAPGLALDYLVGKPSPSTIGYWLNLLVVALGSGLVWGSVLFGASALVARLRRGSA